MTRILVVDREHSLRSRLAESLAGPGRQVVSAATAAQALEQLSDHGADVVVLDTEAPGGWLNVLRELREHDPDAEVILTSSAPAITDLNQAVTFGACSFLPRDADVTVATAAVATAEHRVLLRREAQRLEEALRASEARYRNLFEASPDAIVVYDEDTHEIRDANPAVQRMYGVVPEDLLGRPFSEFWFQSPPPQSVALSQVDPRVFRFLARQDRRADGDVVDVEVSRGSFAHGDRRMVVDVIRDVTRKLRDENERRELEAQLRQAQKTEALGLLAGGIAHDFNNLLAVILNYATFAKESLEEAGDGAAESALRDIQQVLTATRSASLVTRQLLTFSRREVVSPELLDVSEVIDNITQLMRSSLGTNCAIQLDLERDLPKTRLDRGQVEQIVLNLALNARDAMPEGGTLRIHTLQTRDKDGKRQIAIRIADTGIGIPATVLPLIFDPFFTTKERGKGTGLGLATVRGIVDRAGGEVHVESTPGEGTTFELRFPASSQRTSIRSVATPAGQPRGGSETVLLVDDDDPVRRAARRILVRAGYRVLEAHDADEATATFRAHPDVALLVTDLMMPGKSGEELARELRETSPELPVIYVSGFSTQSVIDEVDELELAAVLAKPYHAHNLLTVVRELLDTRCVSSSRYPVALRAAAGAR
ncbi:MAG: response regulator [Polyangiaceae bacterium]